MAAETQEREAAGKVFPRGTRRHLHTLFESKNKPRIRRGIAAIMNSGFSHDDIKREYEAWRNEKMKK